MAVKSRKEGEKLILELDNGDVTKLEQAWVIFLIVLGALLQGLSRCYF